MTFGVVIHNVVSVEWNSAAADEVETIVVNLHGGGEAKIALFKHREIQPAIPVDKYPVLPEPA